MTKILVEYGIKMKMHKVLRYSRPTINAALKGESDTNIARRIRKYAMLHGGVEISK